MKASELIVGLMSGTSADAIDAALVEFTGNDFKLLNTYEHPLSDTLKKQIFSLFEPGDNEIERQGRLDRLLGHEFAEATKRLLQQSGHKPSAITAIGSHGQTIRHRPNLKNGTAFSLQIGDPNTIARETGITTIADFRRKDIAEGGQGAPLTPAFHRAAFAAQTNDRFVLNIGGIANITHLPVKGPITGFDTGPGNGLMDYWIQKSLSETYDRAGQWSQQGCANEALLSTLLSHPYFTKTAPKSTGKEEFSREWLDPILENADLAAQDIQATLLELSAESICSEINKRATSNQNADVITCGGGVHNTALIKRLEEKLPQCKVASSEEFGVHPDWVEAVAFAWLARQTLNNLPGNLCQVTGAQKEVVLGGIYLS